MYTREIALKIAKNFTKELMNKGISLKTAILFGSISKNIQNELSDIDLALVSDDFTGIGYIDKKLFSDIKIKEEFHDIDTKTYKTGYFEKGDPFIKEILKHGIKIL